MIPVTMLIKIVFNVKYRDTVMEQTGRGRARPGKGPQIYGSSGDRACAAGVSKP